MRTTGCLLTASIIISALYDAAALAQTQAAAPLPAAVTAAVEAGAPLQTAPSPEQTAFRADLLRETADLSPEEGGAIRAFYETRDYQPFWTADGAAEVAALVAALEAAPAHGLPLRRYDPGALETLASSGEPATLIEVAAARTYLSFARDLHSGLLTPSRVDEEINLAPIRLSPAVLLARLNDAPVDVALRALEPASPEYRKLMAEKARIETEALAADWGPEVAAGTTLRLGDAGPRVTALRARLTARGFAAEGAPGADAGAAGFDLGLEAALERFQAAGGIEPDGLAGPQTLAAVNAAPSAQLGQVIVNLERLRWMNRDLGARHIWANIPDFTVKMVEDGATVYASRVVVGKSTETRTPEFSERMTYFVVNPTWHIPDSIAQRVYLPKLKANAATLANSNMRLFTRAGTEINPGLVDFTQFNSGNFPFRIKQNPSSENALGRVKFMFPNQFSIYLHDTPLRELFAKEMRAFSNGCVRVEDPLDLAYLLLEGQVEDPEASFAGWLAAKTERTVNLEQPIPVHLVYRTAFVDEAGAVQYRFDVYGRDATVLDALTAAGVTMPAAQG